MVFTLYIQTNSPGEVTSWVYPICRAFMESGRRVEIVVFLTPCQYATGQEAQRLRTFPGVKQVYTPAQTFRFLATFPLSNPHQGVGAVLFLGGDPWYSRLLGWKLKLPIFGYTASSDLKWWGFSYLFALPRDGDLMQSRVSYGEQDIAASSKYVGPEYALFLPGSRTQHFVHILPLFLSLIPQLILAFPEITIKVLISPFITDTMLASFDLDDERVEFVRGDSLYWMHHAKWILTIPGTNTSEAMYLNVPMIVVLPLNHPEVLIFDGLVGWLTKIPILGNLILSVVIGWLKRQDRFYALPNIRTGRAIVSEWVDIFDPPKLANRLINQLQKPFFLENCHRDLSLAFPKSDPQSATRISDQIFRYFNL